jgi:enamine deaminase RidA (YjgF/YER057c/UK114 family)
MAPMKPKVLAVVGGVIVGLVAGASWGRKTAVRKHFPAARPDLPFSEAVLAGDTLYLAGKIGLDPATGKPPAEVEDEARLVMDAVKGTLARAGMTMDDLVSVQIFCSDVSLFPRFNAVYRGYFKDLPARAFIGSGKLLFDARFEVQGIAVKR